MDLSTDPLGTLNISGLLARDGTLYSVDQQFQLSPQVPALSALTLTELALLMLTGGIAVLRRRRLSPLARRSPSQQTT